jgi:hypothetical protein
MPRRKNIAAALRKNESLQQIAKSLTAPGDQGRSVPAPIRGTVTDKTDAPGHTDIYTYFTRPNGKSNLFYSAEKWVTVSLLLETGGPVSVSTRQDILPVLSGKGISLRTGEVRQWELARGDRLFIASTSSNRVQVITQPVPWLESLLLTTQKGYQAVVSSDHQIVRAVEKIGSSIVSTLTGRGR